MVLQGLYWVNIGIILGLYWDNGKENGNCYLSFGGGKGMTIHCASLMSQVG